MSTALRKRIHTLERVHRFDEKAQACPECGRMPNGRFPSQVKPRYEVVFDDPLNPETEHCSTCGVRTVLRVEFDARG